MREYSVIATYGGILNTFKLCSVLDTVQSKVRSISQFSDFSFDHIFSRISGRKRIFNTIEKYSKYIESTGFNLGDSIEGYRLNADSEIPSEDCMAAMLLKSGEYCCFGIDSEAMPLSSSIIINIAKLIIDTADSDYGMIYFRKHALGPLWYTVGQESNPEENRNVDLDREWDDNESNEFWSEYGLPDRLYEECIRNVYPINFLNKRHLEFRIDGYSFHKWVQQDVIRGNIVEFNKKTWQWTVAIDNISHIRQQLKRAGFVIGYPEEDEK